MTIHEQKLRAMAKQMPIFATELVAAADNIKELKCAIWADRPDINKIKADAVREAIEILYDECSYLDSSPRYSLEGLANKLEKGE